MTATGTIARHPLTSAVGMASALLALLAAIGALAASARADVEPNDGIAEAEGPLSGGVLYNGAIVTENDVDTYVFYVAGQVALDVNVTDISNSCLQASLGDANNSGLQEHTFYSENEHGSAELTYTTAPGTNRFYLQFQPCNGETGEYSFSISPAAAIVAGPATPTPNAVPGLHESADEAFGPLSANVAYTDTLLTSNDQNWLTFFTPAAQETVDVEATRLSSGGCGWTELTVDNEGLSIGSGRWSHHTFTSSVPAQHFISVGDCVGMSWEVIVKAASLSTALQLPFAPPPPPPPPPPSNACLHDRANLAKAQLRVRRYRRELASRRLSRKARRANRRRLSHAEKLVKRYAALRGSQCPDGR